MSAQAPLDRLAPQDMYRLLDWLRDDWETCDEVDNARALTRLRRHFEHLPTPFWDRARPLLLELATSRLYKGRPWRQTIRSLSELVSEWERSRPPLLACPECELEVRGHRALEAHRYVVHEVGVA